MSILRCVFEEQLTDTYTCALTAIWSIANVSRFPMDSYETFCQRITFHKKILWRAIINNIICIVATKKIH